MISFLDSVDYRVSAQLLSQGIVPPPPSGTPDSDSGSRSSRSPSRSPRRRTRRDSRSRSHRRSRYVLEHHN